MYVFSLPLVLSLIIKTLGGIVRPGKVIFNDITKESGFYASVLLFGAYKRVLRKDDGH